MAQLRYFRSLSLRAKLEAVEGMADVVRRLQRMRRDGKLVTTRSPEVRSPGTTSPGRSG